MFKIIDRYIIKRYLGTFAFAILLIMLIAIVFDISEKLDSFLDNHAPLHEIVFQYYLLGFVPYYTLLFTSLLLFLTVVFFTSRMAYKSEIVAILSSGVTFNRFLRPYVLSAVVITALNIISNMWLLPYANTNKLTFERHYIDNHYTNNSSNLHFQVAPGTYAYFQNYEVVDSTGINFCLQKFDHTNEQYELHAIRAHWDKKKKGWQLMDYMYRVHGDMNDVIVKGKDTLVHLNLTPADFDEKEENIGSMNLKELDQFIISEKIKGASLIPFYEVEKYKRVAFPFALIILTVIGVSLTSRKVRGGSGLHMLAGIALCFGYIVFMQFTTTFSTKGTLPPIIGVWIPNVVYSGIAYYLYRRAPK